MHPPTTKHTIMHKLTYKSHCRLGQVNRLSTLKNSIKTKKMVHYLTPWNVDGYQKALQCWSGALALGVVVVIGAVLLSFLLPRSQHVVEWVMADTLTTTERSKWLLHSETTNKNLALFGVDCGHIELTDYKGWGVSGKLLPC